MIRTRLLIFECSFPAMTDVRIICAHDGVKTAQALMRLLEAEQHKVELCYGRPSLDHLEAARGAREAVILIWSLDAPSALYMLTWMQSIEPTRLIEIARTRRWPNSETRLGVVIDFSAWNGERGGPAWRALTERLRTIARALEPPRPPPLRAAMALGAVSVLAVGGAIFERLHAPEAPPVTAQSNMAVAETTVLEEDGRGGPTDVVEPDSYIESDLQFGHVLPHAALLEAPHSHTLVAPRLAPAMQFREASLLQRLADLGRSNQTID